MRDRTAISEVEDTVSFHVIAIDADHPGVTDDLRFGHEENSPKRVQV